MTGLARLVAIAVMVGVGGLAAAAEPDGTAVYAAAVKRAAAGHLAALGALLRRQVPYQDHLVMHAQALRDIAAAGEALYPPQDDAGPDPSGADDRPGSPEFEARLADWREASEAALEAARQHDLQGFAPAFRRLAESCRACHESS